MTRQPHAHSVFTIVEIMIVIVIIGLLTAMAIPAFVMVRQASIEKAMKHGEYVTDAQRQYVRDRRAAGHYTSVYPKDSDGDAPERQERKVPATPGLKTLESNGVRYYLIPKTSSYPNEMTIGSDTYYMVPVPSGQ